MKPFRLLKGRTSLKGFAVATALLLLGPSFRMAAQTPLVGSLGGEVVVTQEGLATYSIPIEVVPGTHGVQPTLSVNYNSAGGRGLLGSCWDLGGLSSIARTPRTPYHDGDAGSVNFDSDDRYSLDGTRLVRLSNGSYAAQGAVYGKEVEDFTRVTLNGTPDSSSQYFTAVTGDGTLVEYGNGENSLQQLAGKTLAWWVHRVTDPDGNHMSFRYLLDDGEIRPDIIYYTGNQYAGLSSYAKVVFKYIDDPNANTSWVGGRQTTVSHLLSGITTCYGADTVMRYTFEYDLGRTSRLTAVVLSDAEGTELTRTTVSWGADGATASFRVLQGLTQASPVPGDFDGDGITDLFMYCHDPDGNQTVWYVMKGTASGQFASTELSGSFTGYVQPEGIFPLDIDGNGTDEIGVILNGIPQDSCSFKTVRFNGNGYSYATEAVNATGIFLLGDFLGTGSMQVATVSEASGNQRTVTCLANNASFTVHKDGRLGVTDLNGNGKYDIQVVKDQTIDVYEYDARSGGFTKLIDAHYMAHPSTRDYFGDFNGDGYTDYVYFGSHGFFLRVSKGNDYAPSSSLPFSAVPANGDPENPLVIGDANGDGKDDAVQLFYNYITNRATLVAYFSRGLAGETYLYDTAHFQNSAVSHCTESMYRFAEMDGDGQQELFYAGSIFNNPVVVSFPERRGHDLAASFTDGYGKTTLLAYGYYNTPGTRFSGSQMQHVRWPLVTRTAEPDGTGGTAVTFHTYGDAHYDHDRRLMLGFGWYSAYHGGDNVRRHSLHDPVLHRMALEQVLAYYLTDDTTGMGGYVHDPGFWNRNEGILYHYETFNTPAALTLGYGRFLPYDSVSSRLDRLENTKATTTTRLGPDGRIAWQSTAYGKGRPVNGAPPPWLERDSTAFTYQTVALPNGEQTTRPASVKTWHRRNGSSQAPWTGTAYAYAQGRLRKVERSDGDGLIDSTLYTYNGFGLPLTVTSAPQGIPPATATFTYDSKGRFATAVTDALGHTSTTQYDKKTGLPARETDPNGISTSYQRDALGRVTRMTRHDGTSIQTSYEWNSGSPFPDAVWRVRQTGAGRPETVEWRDILGRTVHSYQDGRGFDDIVYDSLGRPAMATAVPYTDISTARKVWRTTAFDHYGRTLSVTAPCTSLHYGYYDPTDPLQSDYRVTVTDSIRGTQRTLTYDPMGRLKGAVDAGGSVTYEYDYVTSGGRTLDRTRITAVGCVTTVLTDMRGNRLELQDPDAGTVTSTYDALGRIASRTDANGNTASYTYDALGRTLTVTLSDGIGSETVGYTYDDAPGRGIGMLSTVTHDGLDECSYRYDTLGRVVRMDVFDGQDTHTHLFDYDSLGRLLHLTYPSGFRTRHTYNAFGEPLSVYDDSGNTLVFSTDSRNSLRQPLKCRYGNGSGVQYSYNGYGLLTAIRNGDVATGSNADGDGEGDTDSGPVQETTYTVGTEYRQLSYAYDGRGFIVSRSDANTAQCETYDYDALDRLVRRRVNGVTADSLAYDGRGNITLNAGLGTYGYDGYGPHAVSRVTGSLARPQQGPDHDATYGIRNLPVSIAGGGFTITLDYDADGMRRHTRFFDGNTLQKTSTRVSRLHEVETRGSQTRKLDYIYAGGRVVAVHVANGNADSLYYVLSDHLGSWNMVMDGAKNTVQSTHFDPWGNRMSHNAWATTQTQVSFPFSRGFTGHEHYDRFGIINANARLYDPVTGRFFSPDPFVQVPDFTQSFNRYSYCMNNPVMFSDPDGESMLAISMIVGAVVCAYIGGTAANGWIYNPCSWSWDGKTWAGMGLGAVAGAAAGLAFAYAAPALASTAFMSHFGASGAMTSYTLSGFATLGAGGYASGFGGGMLYSNGDAHYSHLSGVQGFKVGATVGALAGQLAGEIVSYKPPRQSYSMTIEPESKWKGNYFQGTEEEARQSLVETSMLFKTETAMWCTSRGYYFEPVSGEAYKYNKEFDFDGNCYKLTEYNIPVGPRTNTINKSHFFTQLDLIDDNVYLYPENGPVSKVYYHAHTHPHNSAPSNADNLFSFLFGIPCRVYGWNGCVYYYGGPGYWH